MCNHTKILQIALYMLLTSIVLTSCITERYRENHKNKLSKKAERAENFLAEQAIDITQENIQNKDKKEKKTRKRLQKQQEEINEANAKENSKKNTKMQHLNFRFY